MRSILILAIFTLLFVSCHNDVPKLPSERKFCGYTDINGKQWCKRIYDEIDESDCKKIIAKDDKFFCDADCTQTEPCEE